MDQKGKPSSTLFTRLSYNGKSSLLQCEIQTYSYNDVLLFVLLGEPETGRMHQIRVHLQWLGKTIVERDSSLLFLSGTQDSLSLVILCTTILHGVPRGDKLVKELKIWMRSVILSTLLIIFPLTAFIR